MKVERIPIAKCLYEANVPDHTMVGLRHLDPDHGRDAAFKRPVDSIEAKLYLPWHVAPSGCTSTMSTTAFTENENEEKELIE